MRQHLYNSIYRVFLIKKLFDIKSYQGFNYYISSAGGYSVKAKKTKSFVYYTNGRSKRTTALLGLFKSYPKLLPGSTIVVPSKQERSGKFDPSKVGILVSALTTLATTLAILKGL